MQRLLLSTLLVTTLGLTACNFGSKSLTDSSQSSSSSSSPSEDTGDLVTHNVSYIGTVEELGMTVYQQGTHTLRLDGNQSLLLESTDVNLNLNIYLGKKVEIHGSLQPTVEAGGMILKAEEVVVLDTDSSSFSSSEESMVGSRKMCGGIAGLPCDENEMCIDDTSDSCDPLNGGADCSGVCVPKAMESSSNSSEAMSSAMSSSQVKSTSSSVRSVAQTSVSSASSVSSISSSQASSSSDSSVHEEQNVLLAKQTYDKPELWTQKYCTSHIAFCIPVHKNWYFKSFGATTNNLWHVEMGMNDIAELGQGAIILNLVSGSSASMQAQDGQIKTQGADVIGFKDWEDGTHFEIIADARLKVAVSYMISRITPYTVAQ